MKKKKLYSTIYHEAKKKKNKTTENQQRQTAFLTSPSNQEIFFHFSYFFSFFLGLSSSIHPLSPPPFPFFFFLILVCFDLLNLGPSILRAFSGPFKTSIQTRRPEPKIKKVTRIERKRMKGKKTGVESPAGDIISCCCILETAVSSPRQASRHASSFHFNMRVRRSTQKANRHITHHFV